MDIPESVCTETGTYFRSPTKASSGMLPLITCIEPCEGPHQKTTKRVAKYSSIKLINEISEYILKMKVTSIKSRKLDRWICGHSAAGASYNGGMSCSSRAHSKWWRGHRNAMSARRFASTTSVAPYPEKPTTSTPPCSITCQRADKINYIEDRECHLRPATPADGRSGLGK